jgi:pyruvate/2-oxoglutarate dehydrogenase complex dihydrolipoamide acyltransferase (E2) component
MRTSMRAGVNVLVASFALASCAAPGGTSVPQTTRVGYYPQCYQSVALLRQQDQQFQQTMAVNTLSGAVGGAALGALIGRDWKSALIGAAAGAATAAAATYASARLQQQPNDELRRGAIAGDMYHDSGELQRAVVAARQADSCYGVAYNQLVAGLRSGAISKADAIQRFTEIDQGEREVGAILAEYGKKTQASVQQYEVAFDQEAQRLNTTPNQLLAETGAPPSGSRAPAPRSAQPVSQNTRQMAQNYSKLNQQVSEINQEQSSIERTANDRRNNMHALGVDVSA